MWGVGILAGKTLSGKCLFGCTEQDEWVCGGCFWRWISESLAEVMQKFRLEATASLTFFSGKHKEQTD